MGLRRGWKPSKSKATGILQSRRGSTRCYRQGDRSRMPARPSSSGNSRGGPGNCTGTSGTPASPVPPSNSRARGPSPAEGVATGADRPALGASQLRPEAGIDSSARLVGLISDTHGLLRPEAIRALQGSEVIVHAGDIGKAAVLAALRAMGPVTAVRGNVDTKGWARGLPTAAAIEIDRIRLYVIHDLKELDFAPEAAGFRVVVSGHSHRPSLRKRNGVLFVNPGSAGPRRFRLPVSIALLSIRDNAVEVKLETLDV